MDRGTQGRHRRWQLAAVWVVAVAVAIVVASWAVGTASRQVTDPVAAVLAQTTGAPAVADPTTPEPTATGDDPTPTASPDDQPTGGPSPTPSPSGSASPGPATAAAPTTRTASALGGSAAFRFDDGRVSLLWARPEPGFVVDVEREGIEATARFRSPAHESRIKADLEDGQPRIRVEERPEDDA